MNGSSNGVQHLATKGAHPVIAVAVAMILVQTGFRAWALYPSWFFTDDYHVLIEALDTPLSLGYLLEPFNSHVMPFARLMVWVVATVGPLSWGVAATITLSLQVAASLACLWMLTTVFGRRWAILGPLALYLTSAVTMPATMWWIAALNQLPYQVVFFVCVGTWVRYLRGGGWLWALLTFVGLMAGFASYVKTPLIPGVLLALTIFWFGDARWVLRPWKLPAKILAPLSAMVILVIGYAVYYIGFVPQPFGEAAEIKLPQVADAMLGTSMTTSLLGGPWQWWETTPPTVLAAPPNSAVHLAWVVIVAIICVGALLREGTLKAWALAGAYAVLLLGLLATSRGTIYGALAGLDFRYLTDIICIAVLCVGLAFLGVPGARASSRARSEPLLRFARPTPAIIGLVMVVAVGGMWSSATYAGFWHHKNASRPFVDNLAASLRDDPGRTDLVAQVLDETVMPPYTSPANESPSFLKLLPGEAQFPDATSRLGIISPSGEVRQADIQELTRSEPGPKGNCGWYVKGLGRDIPLTDGVEGWAGWARVGYLASGDSNVTVVAGTTTRHTQVAAGLNNLFIRLDGSFRSIKIGGLDDEVGMCVDAVVLGQPVVGGAFE